ncbi:MAG: hypothetical protein KGK34_09090 [Chloroflexota bacterium]|nr:hypothetical protein [Chloroflexota bacterium]
MNVVEIAVRFTVAWLAVGLGLFVAAGSFRELRPAVAVHGSARRGRAWRPLYAVPFLFALALLGVGVVEAMRAVPW